MGLLRMILEEVMVISGSAEWSVIEYRTIIQVHVGLRETKVFLHWVPKLDIRCIFNVHLPLSSFRDNTDNFSLHVSSPIYFQIVRIVVRVFANP